MAITPQELHAILRGLRFRHEFIELFDQFPGAPDLGAFEAWVATVMSRSQPAWPVRDWIHTAQDEGRRYHCYRGESPTVKDVRIAIAWQGEDGFDYPEDTLLYAVARMLLGEPVRRYDFPLLTARVFVWPWERVGR